MGIHLREKKLSNGKVSLYLDIYHNKKRWYEFLNIQVSKSKPTPDDKEKRLLAKEIKVKRENEIVVLDNGLSDKTKKKADFVIWFEAYMKSRELEHSHNLSTLLHLQRYMGGKPLPFTRITPDWLRIYANHLVTIVSHNTVCDYQRNMFTALEEAVRQEIIHVNPFRRIPRHERLQKKPIFRNAFSLDELGALWLKKETIELQYSLGFLYACFTGLRWSDVNCLKWSEIITKTIMGKKEWFIYFEQEKTEDIEYLPLSDQAILILKMRKGQQKESNDDSKYVFPLLLETDKKKTPVGKRVGYYLKIWAKAAGLDSRRMHFHSSRHTFATNVLENSPEGDLWTVSKLLGHKSISATQIYAHVRDSRKVAAVKALPKISLNITHAA